MGDNSRRWFLALTDDEHEMVLTDRERRSKNPEDRPLAAVICLDCGGAPYIECLREGHNFGGKR